MQPVKIKLGSITPLFPAVYRVAAAVGASQVFDDENIIVAQEVDFKAVSSI
jgi:hypothetical protein